MDSEMHPDRPLDAPQLLMGRAELSRRDLLRLTLRLSALAGLALLGRKVQSAESGTLPTEPCPSGGACGGCPRRRDCGLPRGVTARRTLDPGAQP